MLAPPFALPGINVKGTRWCQKGRACDGMVTEEVVPRGNSGSASLGVVSGLWLDSGVISVAVAGGKVS